MIHLFFVDHWKKKLNQVVEVIHIHQLLNTVILLRRKVKSQILPMFRIFILILIAFVFLETNNIKVGQIFKLRKSIERIFECRLKPSSSFSSLPRSKTYDRKRPVPWYSGDFIEAVFRWPDLSGFARNQQEPVKTGSRIRSPDSCVEFLALPGGFRPETGSFLRVFGGNSRNTASGIIDLGKFIIIIIIIVNNKNPRSKPRRCLIWSKKPKIQAFLITQFDGIDIDDARFDCRSLSNDYVRKRLVPITPKKAFDGKRAITAITRIKNPAKHIENSYLLLIPVEVEEEDIKQGKLLDEFFDENDLLYINGLLLSITNQENEQQAKAKQEEIKKLVTITCQMTMMIIIMLVRMKVNHQYQQEEVLQIQLLIQQKKFRFGWKIVS